MTCVVGFVLSMLLTTALSALTSINQYIPAQQVFVAALVLAGIISFILVFPLRINITVIGQRRQFTYLCRWL
ncbi:MAG TPA: hypothetical protein VHO23_00465 [Candidatus Paceibacterota bacterium]|nr:hypothetical protein [Candidatus Paceibacterota bacterium]